MLGRGLWPWLAALVVALVCALPAMAEHSSSTTTQQVQQLRAGIAWHRARTWYWQDVAHVARTRTAHAERTTAGRAYLAWIAARWHHRRLAARAQAAAYVRHQRALAAARPSHWSLWSCITNGAYPGAPHEGNGYNGSYTGPLGMTTPWAGHYPTGGDWVHTPVATVYAYAEQEYVAHGYSRTWLLQQWPTTGRACT